MKCTIQWRAPCVVVWMWSNNTRTQDEHPTSVSPAMWAGMVKGKPHSMELDREESKTEQTAGLQMGEKRQWSWSWRQREQESERERGPEGRQEPKMKAAPLRWRTRGCVPRTVPYEQFLSPVISTSTRPHSRFLRPRK